jgi:hypothetical protein
MKRGSLHATRIDILMLGMCVTGQGGFGRRIEDKVEPLSIMTAIIAMATLSGA